MEYTQKQLAILKQTISVTEDEMLSMREDQLFRHIKDEMAHSLGVFIVNNLDETPVTFSFSDRFTEEGLIREFELELVVIDRTVLDELMQYRSMYGRIRGNY